MGFIQYLLGRQAKEPKWECPRSAYGHVWIRFKEEPDDKGTYIQYHRCKWCKTVKEVEEAILGSDLS